MSKSEQFTSMLARLQAYDEQRPVLVYSLEAADRASDREFESRNPGSTSHDESNEEAP